MTELSESVLSSVEATSTDIGKNLFNICNSLTTFVSVFMIKSPWRLNGEDTEQMYSKHLSV